MSKSQYKIAYIGREMLLKCLKKKKKNLYFYGRHTNVPFCFVNKELDIHQGLTFKTYKFGKEQLGFKLGEFAKTRVTAHHKGKRLKISKKRPKVLTKKFKYDLKSKFFTS